MEAPPEAAAAREGTPQSVFPEKPIPAPAEPQAAIRTLRLGRRLRRWALPVLPEQVEEQARLPITGEGKAVPA